MYYLMSKKNDDGNEIVCGQRHVTEENREEVLHKFETWDSVLEYLFDPIGWKERNLSDA